MKLKSLAFCLLAAVIVTLGIGCDIIFGNNSRTGIMIDLGEISGDGSRAVGTPPVSISSGITSFTVTITAPDLKTIQQDVSLGAKYVNIEIPAGEDRTIRLDANMSQAWATANSREHILSYAAEQTVDLRPGKFTGLRFRLEVGMTKLIVPAYYEGYIYRVPNMHPGSIADLSIYNHGTTWRPYDIDMEGTGRIFFTDASTTIKVINSVYDTSASSYTHGFSGTTVLTIDNVGNWIYSYGNIAGVGNRIRRVSTVVLLPPPAVTYTLPTNISTANYSIVDMEYRDGYLYILGLNSSNAPCVFRWIPGATTAEMSTVNAHLDNPQDMLVKSDYIYVTNFPNNPYANNAGDWACIELYDKKTLAFIGSYGTRLAYPGVGSFPYDNRPGYFYGPHHFIAPGNRKIYVIDDSAETGSGQNRIIAFDDIKTWEGWEIFRTESLNPTTEYRYYCC